MKSKQVQEFKETEIGKIPADWEVISINDSYPLYHNIWKNNEQIQSLTKTLDTLLPKLMSGEIRV